MFVTRSLERRFLLLSFIVIIHPRPQAQAQAALTVALFQAVDLRRNSDAEAWSHSMYIAL